MVRSSCDTLYTELCDWLVGVRPHNSGRLAVLSDSTKTLLYLACACLFVVDCTSVQCVELKVTSVDAFILSQQILLLYKALVFESLTDCISML